MFNLRRLFIRFATPLAWRLSERRKAMALLEFSLIEKDSATQLLDAFHLLDDPRAKAGLFQHVLEEYHHADLFERVCEEVSPTPLIMPVIPRERLLDEEKSNFDKLGFLTYVHVGEKNVNRDFSVYAKAATDRRVADVFRAVQADEAGHEAETFGHLKALAGNKKSVLYWSLFKAECQLWYRAYVGYARRFGELFLTLWLTILYFVFGWAIAPAARARLGLAKKEQLKYFAAAQGQLKV